MSLSRPLRLIFLVSFLFGLHFSLGMYVNSSFLSDGCSCGIPSSLVGVLFAVAAFISILGITRAPIVFRWFYGSKRTLLAGMLVSAAALLGMMTSQSPWLAALFFVVYAGVANFVIFVADLFVEVYSSDATTGNTRGLYLTVLSAATMISPLVAGLLVEKASGYFIIYGLGVFLVALTVLLFTLNSRQVVEADCPRLSLRGTFKRFNSYKSGDVRRVFIANFLLQFFYSWMIVYTPIYLNQYVGLPWSSIGIIFTVMLSPFVLLQIPIGRLADTRYGEKEMMIIGFVVMAIATGLLTYVGTATVWVWALLLFMTRVGASAVQITTESYFFKQVEGHDIDLISIFRDTSPFAFMVGPLVATFFLTMGLDIRYMFIVLAAFVLSGILFITRLRDTK